MAWRSPRRHAAASRATTSLAAGRLLAQARQPGRRVAVAQVEFDQAFVVRGGGVLRAGLLVQPRQLVADLLRLVGGVVVDQLEVRLVLLDREREQPLLGEARAEVAVA